MGMRLFDDRLESRTEPALRRSTLQFLLVAAVVIACTVVIVLQYRNVTDEYMADDAFISFRYAENLADGLGPVWTAGDRVEGYTNFGWVLLLALGEKLGAAPVDTSRALGLLTSVATLALMPALATQLRPAWSGRWWVIVAGASAALALNSGFPLWTFAGLETSAQTFLLSAAVVLHLREDRRGAPALWSAPAFLAAALIRPDSVVFWAVTASFKSLRLISRDWRSRLPGLALWAALFLVPYGAYWLWRWNYYGYFFPNTYYLKTDRSWLIVERGWNYTRDFLTVYWIWLAGGSLVSMWQERRAAYRPTTFLVALLVFWSGYVAYSGGDWMPFYRFFVPALPLLYVLMMNGAVDAVDVLGRRLPSRALPLGVMAVLAVIIAFSAYRPHDSAIAKQTVVFKSPILPGAVDYDIQSAIGLWMRDSLPPDYTVAQVATGIVPYFSRLPTIDMLGVNDIHIAHLDKRLGRGPPGHEKQDGQYVLSRDPEIIWFDLSIAGEPRLEIEDYLPPKYYKYPLNTSITQNLNTWARYRPVAVPFRDGWLNFLVRNDVDLPQPPPGRY